MGHIEIDRPAGVSKSKQMLDPVFRLGAVPTGRPLKRERSCKPFRWPGTSLAGSSWAHPFPDAALQIHRQRLGCSTAAKTQTDLLGILRPTERRTGWRNGQLLDFLVNVLLGLADRHCGREQDFRKHRFPAWQSQDAEFDVGAIGHRFLLKSFLLLRRNDAKPAAQSAA